MKTKVIFRKFKNGDVIAIFPEMLGNWKTHTCESYMHIGQHGACDPQYLIDEITKLATPDEYNDLKLELESIGYDLQVCKRQSYNMIQVKKSKLERIKHDIL